MGLSLRSRRQQRGRNSLSSSDDTRYVFKQSSRSSHQILLRILGKLQPKRLLDLGAWDGALASQIRNFAEVETLTAIEGDVDQIGRIVKVFDRAIIADLERLTRLPRPVDVIVMADVLEHLARPEALLALAAETLDQEGAIIVSIPNIANLTTRLGLLFGRFEYQDRGILDRTHLRFYTLASARRLLREAGLRIEAEQTSSVPLDLALPWMPSILMRPLGWITDALTSLLPRLLGYQFIFVARKSER